MKLPEHTAEPVHPRVCGEQHDFVYTLNECDGSSPRVWGTAGRFRKLTLESRFIPACVGNSGIL